MRQGKLHVTIHYHRNNQDYEGWNIHTWSTGVSDGDYEFTSEGRFWVKLQLLT